MNKILSSAFVYDCKIRRDVIKCDLTDSYTKVCSWDVAISPEWLFGDDMVKSVKDITDTAVVAKRLTKKPKTSSSVARKSVIPQPVPYPYPQFWRGQSFLRRKNFRLNRGSFSNNYAYPKKSQNYHGNKKTKFSK